MSGEFETGIIIGIENDIATVELQENEQCHSCGARMICHPGDSGKRVLKLQNTLNAEIGDKILIDQSEKNQLRLAFMQYGFPLLGFLVTVLITGLFVKNSIVGIPSEVFQFIIALGALLLAGLFTRKWAVRKAATDFSVFSMKEICR